MKLVKSFFLVEDGGGYVGVKNFVVGSTEVEG
jgi:hypothetical protein